MSDSLYNSQDTGDGAPKSSSSGKILLVLAFLGVLIFVAHSWRSRQPVYSIAVKGNETLSSEEVLKNIDSSLRNKSVEEVELASVKDEIEKNPLVEQAVVKRHGVRGIEVVVQERQPVAAIVYPEGILKFIDSAMVELPYDRFLKKSDVPLLRGLVLKTGLDTQALKNSLEIVQKIGNYNNENFGAISEIEFNRAEGTFLLIDSDGIQVLLGGKTVSAALQKLKKLQQSAFLKSGIEYIDLRWQGRVITRKRKVTI